MSFFFVLGYHTFPDARGSARSRDHEAWWQRRDFFTEVPSGEEPLCINVSGLTCTDFSPLGLQSRESGKSERVHAVWECDRRHCARHELEHMFFSENSTRYPAEEKQGQLSDDYHILCMRVSPHELGFPMRRPRCFTAGVSKAKFHWLGPHGTEAIERDFKSWFRKDLLLDGDVFLNAEPSQVRAWVDSVLQRRRKSLPAAFESKNMDEYLSLLLSPSALGRKHVYDGDRAARGGSDAYLCDLDQNLGYGPSPGPLMPCLDSHPSIFSYNRRRLAIPIELLAAQGIDTLPSLQGNRKPSQLGMLLQKLEDRSVKSLLGNSIHVPSYAAWFLYILSNCSRKEQVKIPAPLKFLRVSRQTTREFEEEC